MAGYLYASRKKASIIIDTDDDNIPKCDWSFPLFSGAFDAISSNQGFVNIYSYFTDQKIWPRGFPLRLINQNTKNKLIHNQWTKIGIWQGLADEDPDVDAVYRLTSNEYCNFKKREPIVFQNGSLCPINTQNTAIINELFSLLYLPCHVTFRFTDILRGIIAQPIMWAAGYYLGFTDATVIQKRNPHDYFEDFISEIPMYNYVEKVVELVSGVVKVTNNIQDNLFNAYTQLEKNNIVSSKELKLLECWLFDMAAN
jgi:hypothetical protein